MCLHQLCTKRGIWFGGIFDLRRSQYYWFIISCYWQNNEKLQKRSKFCKFGKCLAGRRRLYIVNRYLHSPGSHQLTRFLESVSDSLTDWVTHVGSIASHDANKNSQQGFQRELENPECISWKLKTATKLPAVAYWQGFDRLWWSGGRLSAVKYWQAFDYRALRWRLSAHLASVGQR